MTHISRNDARYATCARCPQTFLQWAGKRYQVLCRDCRSIVTPRERAIWEAK